VRSSRYKLSSLVTSSRPFSLSFTHDYGRGRTILDVVRSAHDIIDPTEHICTLLTEPKNNEYSVRQIAKFGEPVQIPAGSFPVTLLTDNF
jgi:hypothetical protein